MADERIKELNAEIRAVQDELFDLGVERDKTDLDGMSELQLEVELDVIQMQLNQRQGFLGTKSMNCTPIKFGQGSAIICGGRSRRRKQCFTAIPNMNFYAIFRSEKQRAEKRRIAIARCAANIRRKASVRTLISAGSIIRWRKRLTSEETRRKRLIEKFSGAKIINQE